MKNGEVVKQIVVPEKFRNSILKLAHDARLEGIWEIGKQGKEYCRISSGREYSLMCQNIVKPVLSVRKVWLKVESAKLHW